MATYYPNNTTSNNSNSDSDNSNTGQVGQSPVPTTGIVPVLLEDQDQHPRPNTNDLFDTNSHFPWLSTPLSPPLGKKEKSLPVNTKRSPVSGWHSLWSTSTWQNTATDEPIFGQRRSRSVSLMQPSHLPAPQTSSISCSMFDPTAADDYLRMDDNKSPLPSPITYQGSSSSFMTNNNCNNSDRSIWSFDYPSMMNNRNEERRHSIAVTQHHFTRPITPPPYQPSASLQIQQLIQQVQQQQQIDEYFSPTTVVIDVQCLGKGIPSDHLNENQKVYKVQFKANHRLDYFYVQQQQQQQGFQLGDMVIVEADRGYDLGKIVAVYTNKNEVNESVSQVKRIFRHANPAELSTYELKSQDEQKALIICQAKIKQKNLNMEVVDAEYQWRKLTFYFKANERIDFRELVRELFKIYKTRIWMCAFSSVDHT